MDAPLLSIRHLSRGFTAGLAGCFARARALCDISLSVHAGEAVLLRGAPGAGRTTLLLCAAGLLRPDEGAVRWRGRRAIAHLAAPAQYVNARRGLRAGVTVRESLLYHAMLHDATPHAPAVASLAELTDAFAMRGIMHARIDTLGATERARLAITESLLLGARLLLVDDAPPALLPAHMMSVLLSRGVALLIAAVGDLEPALVTRDLTLSDGRITSESVIERERVLLSPARVAELVS